MILCSFNMSHFLICSKTWGKGLKRLKILKIKHFFKFEDACLPTKMTKQVKTLWTLTKYDTLIISCNSNISHSSTCPKTGEKGTKRLKIHEFPADFKHVYIRPEVNSNLFEKLFRLDGNFTTASLEISNPFQKLFCLHGDFTAAIFLTIVRF